MEPPLNTTHMGDSLMYDDDAYYSNYASPPFDEDTFILIEQILRLAVVGVLSCFGIISNLINLIVFYRQGILSHSCTVSLTGLAVSDFFFCVNTLWGSVCLFHAYYVDQADYKWNAVDFYVFTSGRPGITFSDITCWVTAFVAFERLISVTFPFKVKLIFAPKRSCAIIVCIFIGIFIMHLPYNIAYTPRHTDIPQYNFTIIKFEVFELLPKVALDISYYCRFAFRITAMVIVLLCNVIISLKVHFSRKFRQSTMSKMPHSTSASVNNPESSMENSTQVDSKKENKEISYNSNKEMKMVRMITTVCILFGICYIMEFLHICIFTISGWKHNIDYHWISEYTLVVMNSFFLTVNSSCNIIVYYTMSTRYREELDLCLFNRKK